MTVNSRILFTRVDTYPRKYNENLMYRTDTLH